MGVRVFASLNKALLSKWIWWFAVKRTAFWKQVMRGKFGVVEAGWCFKEVSNRYEVGL